MAGDGSRCIAPGSSGVSAPEWSSNRQPRQPQAEAGSDKPRSGWLIGAWVGHEYVTAVVQLHFTSTAVGICHVAAVTEAQSRGHRYRGSTSASQTAQMWFLKRCMMGSKSDLLQPSAGSSQRLRGLPGGRVALRPSTNSVHTVAPVLARWTRPALLQMFCPALALGSVDTGMTLL